MKKQAQDTSWPPLGVRDLNSDKAEKEVMKFGVLRQALTKALETKRP